MPQLCWHFITKSMCIGGRFFRPFSGLYNVCGQGIDPPPLSLRRYLHVGKKFFFRLPDGPLKKTEVYWPPWERYLLPDLCADRGGEPDLRQVRLHRDDAAPGRQAADVHHQHLVLSQLSHLSALLVSCNQSIDQLTKQLINHLINWSVNQLFNQLIDWSIN